MSIYADKKDGQPTGRWVVEVAIKGRRLRGRADNMAEAKVMEADFKQRLETGEASAQAKRRAEHKGSVVTLGEAAKAWGRSLWGDSRLHMEDNLRKIEIITGLRGDVPLAEITREWCAETAAIIEDEREASPGTVNRYLSALSSILKEAEERDMIPKAPKLPWRAETAGRIRWLTPEEEDLMFQFFAVKGYQEISNFCRLALITGMRRGELAKMRAEHIDNGWIRVWDTKNKHARSVPYPAGYLPEGWDGWSHDILWRLRAAWGEMKRALGLEEDDQFVFHMLRHTCATRLVGAGVNLRVVQQYLGHRSIQTTLRYAHVHDTLLLEAAKAITPRNLTGK